MKVIHIFACRYCPHCKKEETYYTCEASKKEIPLRYESTLSIPDWCELDDINSVLVLESSVLLLEQKVAKLEEVNKELLRLSNMTNVEKFEEKRNTATHYPGG